MKHCFASTDLPSSLCYCSADVPGSKLLSGPCRHRPRNWNGSGSSMADSAKRVTFRQLFFGFVVFCDRRIGQIFLCERIDSIRRIPPAFRRHAHHTAKTVFLFSFFVLAFAEQGIFRHLAGRADHSLGAFPELTSKMSWREPIRFRHLV